MKIAVYSICKNEEKHMEGWIKNTEDADIRVLADTGSTDKSIAIFDQFAAPQDWITPITISPFRFDHARNAALAMVPADIDVCVCLDIDERLQPGWREGIEKAWKQFPDLTRLGIQYETKGFKTFIHNSRVHARNGYFWKDPCHEALHPWMIDENQETVSNTVRIVHEPDYGKPRTRLLLLAHGVHEEPWNRRRIFYYGRELVLEGQTQAGLDWLKKYMELWAKAGEAMWWEPEQAEVYIRLAEGVLTEKATH